MKSTFCNESHILEKHSCNFPFEFASIGPSSQLVPGSSVQRSVGMLHAVCKEKKRADIQAFDIQNLEKKSFLKQDNSLTKRPFSPQIHGNSFISSGPLSINRKHPESQCSPADRKVISLEIQPACCSRGGGDASKERK